jgi:hypothetical protein
MDIDFKNISQEETPPEASAMINTFRAFGYNLRTANKFDIPRKN